MEPVPAAEITLRVEALQKTLAPAGIGLALIRQPADLFYYAGTWWTGSWRWPPGVSHRCWCADPTTGTSRPRAPGPGSCTGI